MSHLLLREVKARPKARFTPGRLLSTCALAAFAAVSLYPQAAHGQAFQASGFSSTGATRQIINGTEETISVNDPQTIINWDFTPAAGVSNFDFLPADNTARFEGNDLSDYLVINRVLSTTNEDPRIDLNGTILSFGTTGVSGRIWFYSPGGILVGQSAQIDVGSLLLTANDPVEILDEFGYGTGSYRFSAQNPTAAVVNQGTITARGSDAYVAMIAPRVTQAGDVTVAGSAAYIAAEVAELTINGTLFDINVTTGSDADTPGGTTLEHSGTTTTELELGYGSLPRQVVMVAVPKNDAVTMLVSGTLGYAQASQAVNSGGRIILSGGYNVAGTSITSRAGDTQATANIGVGTGDFNAVTEMQATGGATVQPAPGETINFADRLSVVGGTSAEIIANSTINIAGDLLLSASDLETGNAGTARLEAGPGSTITIGGSANVSADAAWAFNDATEVGRDALGGTASVIVGAGGNISVGGDLDVTATAQGEFGAEGGGNGQGGTATVSIIGGTLTAGDLLVDTTGIGGDENAGTLGNGGGTGGTSLVEVLDGATLVLTSDSVPQDLEVFAIGGRQPNADISLNGPGRGGTASVIVRNSTVSLASIDVKASAEGGNGPDPQEEGPAAAGYDGTGGTATVELTNASVGTIDFIEIDADGVGGSGGFGTTGGAGGAGRGGTATLLVSGNAVAVTAIELEVDGTGGDGGGSFEGQSGVPGNGGVGGDGFGGMALVEATAGGTLDTEFASFDATGRGGLGGDGSSGVDAGNGGAGGAGTGGTVELLASGGTINITNVEGVLFSAPGFGGQGGLAGFDDGGIIGADGDGGEGTGGTVLLEVQADGLITVTGFATLDASGNGGFGETNSGDGTGGSALIQTSGAGQIDLLDGADLYAYGFGGSGIVLCGDGCVFFPTEQAGDGFGGIASITSLGGPGIINIDGAYVDASGYGGSSGGQGVGGNGQGGQAIVEAGAGAIFNLGNFVDLEAGGYGGGGTASGTGGTARLAVLGGSVVTDDLFVNASGFGTFFESSTGTGTGGAASLLITDGGSLAVTFGTVVVADGNTGTIFENGGAIGPIPPGCPCVAPPPLFPFAAPAGDGFGGTVTVSIDGTLTTPDLIASAKGVGGPASIADEPGFDGVGGNATVEFLSGGSQVDVLTIDARGGGGEGGAGAPGGTGGSGTGGTATLRVAGGTPLLGDLAVLAGGFAGPGGQGINIQGTPFGGGAGGTGIGGTAVVEAGLGGSLTLETFTFDARGQGGAGGAGGDSVQSGADGGDGGDGTGGTVEVRTAGGTIIVTDPDGLQLTAYGLGGVGGGGGDTIDGSGPDGSGGDGGDGTGGNAVINVLGGSITSPDTFVDSSGFGGAGGAAGAGVGDGVAGIGGVAAGGSSRISVADGNGVSGGASLGFVSMDSSGFNADGSPGTAGRLIIEDIGTIAGGLVMDGLFASSFGAASLSGPAFQFTSTDGTVDVAGDVDIFTDGDVVFSAAGSGGLNATGDVGIFTDGSVQLDHLTPAVGAATLSGASVFIDALGSVVGSTGSLIRSTVGNIQVVAPTIDIATAEAAADLLLTAGGANTIVIDVATAGEDIALSSVGDITVGTADAGDDFIAFAGGAFTGTSVTTTGLGPDSEVDGSNIDVAATEDLRLDNGNAADAIFLVSRQGSVLGAGLLQAGTLIELDAAVDVAINDSQSGTSTFVTAGSGIVANAMVAGDNIFGDALNDITIASATAGIDVSLNAANAIVVGLAQVGDDFRASAATTFAADQVVTTGLGLDDDNDGAPDGSNIIVASSGDLRLDNGTAIDTIDLASSAGSVLSDGTLTANALLVDAALDIALNDVFVIQDLNLNAAGGGISGNSFNSDGSISLTSLDAITLFGGATAGTFMDLITTGAGSDISAGTLVADSDIFVDSAGGITLASATSTNGEIELLAIGAVDAGTLSSGASTSIESDTSITVTTATANLAGLPSDEIQGFSATSIGDIVVGTVVAENIGLGTFGSITAGSLTADNLVGLFADGDVSLGNVIAGGLLYVGNPSTAISQNIFDGGLSEAQVEAALLAADPVPTGGDVTSTGLITVRRAIVLAGGDIVLNDIMTLEDLNLVSSGLLSTGNVESIGGMVDLAAAGDMTLGNVRAAGSIFLTGGGLITALDLTAGTGPLLGGGSNGGGGGSGSTTAGIAPGFDDFVFPRNDDGATDAITLPFPVNFFGTEYGQTFVSNNGYITFNFGQGTFTPSGLGTDYFGQPIIAPFFADVDTRNLASAEATYGTGMYAGRQAFGATWDGVGYFPSAADKLNNFQVVLVDRSDTGPGNFDIYYNYTRITWETGGASGGVDGFGGISAAVGYNAGTGNQPGSFFELPGSRVPGSFLDNGTMPLILGTNNGIPGQLQFQVRGGQVIMGMGDISVTNLAPGNTGNITLGNLSATSIDVDSANNLTINSATAIGNIELDASGAVDIVSASTSALLDIDAGGAITAGSLVTQGSGSTVDIDLTGATITVGTASASDDIIMDSAGDVQIGTASAGDFVRVGADGGINFDVITAGDVIILDGRTGISGNVLDAGADINLNSDQGAVSVLTNVASGGNVDVVGTDVDLTAQGNLAIDLAEATTGNVRLAVGGLLDIQGSVLGTQIFLESADISVSGPRIGTTDRTTLIDIVANAPTLFLGGTGGAGYSLDNAEFARFAAGNINVAGNAVTIGELTVLGAAASSPNVLETLSINSSSSIDVVGALAFNNATDANVLSLTAGGEVFVDTAGGSIALTNGGALAGTLEITADAITVASQAAANELATLTTTDARDRRLARNDGPVNEAGYLQAADIVLAANDHIWVQNSGASILTGDRRGITAGPSTITLVATGSTPIEIIINGRQEDGSGGFITGRDLKTQVIFEGEVSPVFTDRSTINGCLISSAVCVSGGNPDLPTIQDFIDEIFGDGSEEDPQFSFARPPLLRLSSLVGLEGFPFAPVIDDPVTGTGDEDFGLGPETTTDQASDITEQVTGTGRERRPECEDEDPTNDQGCEDEAQPEQ